MMRGCRRGRLSHSAAFSSSVISLRGHDEMEDGPSFAPRCLQVLGFQTLALHTASVTEYISRYRRDSPCTPSKQGKSDTRKDGRVYKRYQVFGYPEGFFNFNHKFINTSEHIGRTNNYRQVPDQWYLEIAAR